MHLDKMKKNLLIWRGRFSEGVFHYFLLGALKIVSLVKTLSIVVLFLLFKYSTLFAIIVLDALGISVYAIRRYSRNSMSCGNIFRTIP